MEGEWVGVRMKGGRQGVGGERTGEGHRYQAAAGYWAGRGKSKVGVKADFWARFLGV